MFDAEVIEVPETHFKFPDDRFNFVVATERCVGAAASFMPGVANESLLATKPS